MSDEKNTSNVKIFVKWTAIFIAFIAFVIGAFISSYANDTNKNITEENKTIQELASWLKTISIAILILMALTILAYIFYKKNKGASIVDIFNKLDSMKYILLVIVLILSLLLVTGIFIESYKDDKNLDEESKNDKYAGYGQWITNISAVFMVLAYFLFK